MLRISLHYHAFAWGDVFRSTCVGHHVPAADDVGWTVYSGIAGEGVAHEVEARQISFAEAQTADGDGIVARTKGSRHAKRSADAVGVEIAFFRLDGEVWVQAVSALFVVSPVMRWLFVIVEVVLGGIFGEEAVAQRRNYIVRHGRGDEMPSVFSTAVVACDIFLHCGKQARIVVDELSAVFDGEAATVADDDAVGIGGVATRYGGCGINEDDRVGRGNAVPEPFVCVVPVAVVPEKVDFFVTGSEVNIIVYYETAIFINKSLVVGGNEGGVEVIPSFPLSFYRKIHKSPYIKIM